MKNPPPTSSNTPDLLSDIKTLIHDAKQRTAIAVNSELTLLYWQIGKRINNEVLKGERADYGKQVIAHLSQSLTTQFGKGWSQQRLRHCIKFTDNFSDPQIVSALRRELSGLNHVYPSVNNRARIYDVRQSK